jgi:hypothetical protein
MSLIQPSIIPASALLQAYGSGGGYADCFVTEVPGATSFESFVEAFYTTRLFKVERALLRWFMSKPSSDQDARDLSRGERSTFAAWKVEGRTPSQLLLVDVTGRTRSWLMVEPCEAAPAGRGTRLYFGSAVVARKDRRTGRESMGLAFQALKGFHQLYSRLLLRAACARLRSGR